MAAADKHYKNLYIDKRPVATRWLHTMFYLYFTLTAHLENFASMEASIDHTSLRI